MHRACTFCPKFAACCVTYDFTRRRSMNGIQRIPYELFVMSNDFACFVCEWRGVQFDFEVPCWGLKNAKR